MASETEHTSTRMETYWEFVRFHEMNSLGSWALKVLKQLVRRFDRVRGSQHFGPFCCVTAPFYLGFWGIRVCEEIYHALIFIISAA